MEGTENNFIVGEYYYIPLWDGEIVCCGNYAGKQLTNEGKLLDVFVVNGSPRVFHPDLLKDVKSVKTTF